jgi:F-type H+-transporting ATPase subunit b|tara:strand:+ start:283 stop:747 length:465 start_codon:yes stop_codon:yes gene_type:complete
MIDQLFLILSSEEKGGLFDFGITLPLVAIEFLALMFVLNIILYNPLIQAINDRNEYILDNLAKASDMLIEANNLTTEYEAALAKTRKEASLDVTQSQKIHNEILELELNVSQKYIDDLLDRIINEFSTKKDKILTVLEGEIDALSSQILNKLFA